MSVSAQGDSPHDDRMRDDVVPQDRAPSDGLPSDWARDGSEHGEASRLPVRAVAAEPAVREEREVELADYVAVVRRRWKTAARIFLVVVGAVVLYTFLCDRWYRGSATVQIGDERPLIGFGDLAALTGGDDPVTSEIEILRSRRVAEAVVRNLHLQAVIERGPEGFAFRVDALVFHGREKRALELRFDETGTRFEVFEGDTARAEGTLGWTVDVDDHLSFAIHAGEPHSNQRPSIGLLSNEPASNGPATNGPATNGPASRGAPPDSVVSLVVRPFRNAVRSLMERTVVKGRGRTNIVEVVVEERSPELAAATANDIAKTYMKWIVERRAEQATATKSFITERLTTLEGQLAEAETGLSEYKAGEGITTPDRDAERLLRPWTDHALELAKLRSSREEAERIFTVLSDRAKPTGSGEEEGPGDDRAAEDLPAVAAVGIPSPVLAERIRHLGELQIERSRLASGYRLGHPRMQTLAAEITETQEKLVAELDATIRTLRGREESLEAVLSEYDAEIRRLPSKERGLVERMRESRVAQGLYTVLRERLAEAEIAEASTIGNAWVVDEAIPPLGPSSPRVLLNVALAILIGGLLGLGSVFLIDHLDRTVRSTEQLGELGLSPFGFVPEINVRRPRLRGGAPGGRELRVGRRLTVTADASGFAGEAYRALRTNMRFAYPRGRTPRFAITSAVPGEGKSLTSANLAIALAEGGERVVLVDADLRRPTLHRLFGLERGAGLSDALAGDGQVGEATVPSGVDGLDLLPGGRVPPNPSELLGSARMREALGALSESYDVVLVDTPPVLPFTDAGVFAREVDGAFLVIRAGSTSLDDAERAARNLRAAGSRVLGAILNRVRFEDGFGAAAYADYYSSYESDDDEPRGIVRRALAKPFGWLGRRNGHRDRSNGAQLPPWAQPNGGSSRGENGRPVASAEKDRPLEEELG